MSFPRYPKYRESGIALLGPVPGHWQVKRIRAVARVNPSKSETAGMSRETYVSFLPMEAIGDNGVLRLDMARPLAELESGYTYFRDGDVSIAKITPCYENGKGALMRGLTNGVGFGTTELIVARPDSDYVTSEFLHYLFVSHVFRKIGASHMYGAGGQKRVPDDFVRNFATVFPPVSEQSMITEFLDRETAKIDALAADQRRLIELLKEKRQAVISHSVTKGLNPDAPMKPSGVEWLGDVPAEWHIERLSNVSRFQPGKAHEPFIDAAGDFICVNSRFVSTNGESMKFCTVNLTPARKNDILMVMSDLPNGRALARAYFVDDDRPYAVNQRVCALTPIDADPRFLYYLLNRNQQFLQHDDGISQTHLPNSAFEKFLAPFPSLAEQRSIGVFLDRETAHIDRLTTDARGAISLLEERRTALISAAVTGQIDVRGLAAPNAA